MFQALKTMAFGRYLSLASLMNALARGFREKVCLRTARSVAFSAARERMFSRYCSWVCRYFSRLAAWLWTNDTAPAAKTAIRRAREMRKRRL